MQFRSIRRLAALAGAVAGGVLSAAGTAPAAFNDNIYTAGHADLGVAYEDGDLFLHYHFGGNAVVNGSIIGTDAEVDPSDATTIVPQSWSFGPQSSPLPRPAGSQWDFIGTPAGQPVWILPQNSVNGIPFVGIATEELDGADWAGPITWAVSGFNYAGSGDGEFSIWQQGFGTTVFASTADGLPDTWTQGLGTHDHYNFGFTSPGTYDVQLTASGTHVRDGFKTDTATFRFQLGPQSESVPEPSSLALVGLGAGGLLLVGSRRRKAGAPSMPA